MNKIFQDTVSNLVFYICRIKIVWFKNFLIKLFIIFYKIDLSDFQKKKVNEFINFNDFFTRDIIKEKRPLADSWFVSPVDGTISQKGLIEKKSILQAKGKHYFLENLLVDKNGEQTKNFIDGSFITIYLAPYNYHRIHMPFDGRLMRMDYIAGKLYSVKKNNVDKIDSLFAINERVVCYFSTDYGICAVILVGALFVGSIQTMWHGMVTSENKQNKVWYYDEDIFLKKGDFIGQFNMGSTVIVLMPKKAPEILSNLLVEQNIRLGQTLVLSFYNNYYLIIIYVQKNTINFNFHYFNRMF